jgi:septal ring factor EnvC (AmiA/AmiB activator)
VSARRAQLFERLAKRDQVALHKLARTARTLDEELGRIDGLITQLEEIKAEKAASRHQSASQLRSDAWYLQQIEEQLGTMRNRKSFLETDKGEVRRRMIELEHRKTRAEEHARAARAQDRDEREDRRAALIPLRNRQAG